MSPMRPSMPSIISEAKAPGAMALTLISNRAHSTARVSVMRTGARRSAGSPGRRAGKVRAHVGKWILRRAALAIYRCNGFPTGGPGDLEQRTWYSPDSDAEQTTNENGQRTPSRRIVPDKDRAGG